MKTILKIAVGVVLAVIVMAVGCTALVGGGLSEMEKQQEETGVTQKEFKNLKMGSALEDVRAEFGKPEDTQQTKVKGLTMDCIYYLISGGEIGESYQFCFDNGVLSSKSKF